MDSMQANRTRRRLSLLVALFAMTAASACEPEIADEKYFETCSPDDGCVAEPEMETDVPVCETFPIGEPARDEEWALTLSFEDCSSVAFRSGHITKHNRAGAEHSATVKASVRKAFRVRNNRQAIIAKLKASIDPADWTTEGDKTELPAAYRPGGAHHARFKKALKVTRLANGNYTADDGYLPLPFKDEAEWATFQAELAAALVKAGLSDARIGAYGSGCFGWGSSPWKAIGMGEHPYAYGRNNTASDLDIVLESPTAIDALVKASAKRKNFTTHRPDDPAETGYYPVFEDADVYAKYPAIRDFRDKWVTILKKNATDRGEKFEHINFSTATATGAWGHGDMLIIREPPAPQEREVESGAMTRLERRRPHPDLVVPLPLLGAAALARAAA